MTHIDLFSGIGGFALAAQWAGFRTIVFCEKDELCQKKLRENFPNVPIIQNIEDFDGSKWMGRTLLTGGFPCQPFSTAGRKRGKADDRYLWPEMLRIISKARPDWIIAENVIGIAHMVLAECENDLAAQGYETQSFDIPACACGLPTMERHIWIVAASLRKHMEGRAQGSLPRKTKNPLRIGRPDNPSLERFFGKPNLCEPILYRSRKGIPDFVDRHKALGNAIVPQVAYEIMKAIAEIEA